MGKSTSLDASIRFVAIVAVAILSIQCIGLASARVVNIPPLVFIKSDRIIANEGAVIYNFSGNNQYVVSANVDIQLTLSIGIPLRFQHVNITINSSSDLNLFLQNLEYSLAFPNPRFEEDPDKDGNLTRYQQIWGSYLLFSFNKTGANMTLSVPIGGNYNITATDKFTAYQNGSWHVLPTTTATNNNWLITNIAITQGINFFSVFASNETAPNPEDPPVEPPVDPPVDNLDEILAQEQGRAIVMVSIGAMIGIIVVVAAAISFTGKEYRDYIKAKATNDFETHHKLTIDEVLENENRVIIIDEVLKEPGIHFNELMRKTSLAPGNLVWHLEMLCNYKVIGKKSVGQFMVYYPFAPANPLKNIDITLVKSKVTLQVLNIIENEPGIYGNIIAKRLGLDHKTIKYHVDKLVDARLIVAEKEGRTRKLTPRLPTSLDSSP
jgi:hypothetical protein